MTLKVGSSRIACDIASRAFPYCPVSRYQLAQPLWIEPNCSRMSLTTSLGNPSLKRKSPSSRSLAIPKPKIQFGPLCAHSYVTVFHG